MLEELKASPFDEFSLPRTHLHWVVWAYKSKTPNEQGGYLYHHNVPIEVVALSYDDAIRRCESLCPLSVRYGITGHSLLEAGYDVMSVTEHLDGQCASSGHH